MSAADSAPVLSQLAITPLRPGQKGYQDLSIYTPEQLEFGIALLAKPKRFEVFAPIMIGSVAVPLCLHSIRASTYG